MKGKSEILKLVEISRMYYEQELTQAEIAKKLGISRPAVSKLLAEARLRGIVKIEIASPLESNGDLLAAITDKFNLHGGLVVQTGASEANLKHRLLISQAAQYLETIIPDMKTIGLGWGPDLGNLLDELSALVLNAAKQRAVCPVIGSAPNDIKWFQTNELTRIFSNKTGFTPYYLHAPAFPMSKGNQELFEKTDDYKEISKLWRKLDLVLLGVGTYPSVPDQATAARFGNKLKKSQAVGMLATHYYDRSGTFVESEKDIVMRISINNLMRARKVLIIGSGAKKVNTIVGALNTGLPTHIITDDETARQIIEFSE